MTTGRINQVTPCSVARPTGCCVKHLSQSQHTIHRLRLGRRRYSANQCLAGHRSRLQKAYYTMKKVPHCIAIFATLWHGSTCLHGVNSNDDAASVVHRFTTFGTTELDFSPHLAGQNLYNFPFTATTQDHPCTMRSEPACWSPSLGPIAVLAGKQVTAPNNTGQGRRQNVMPISYPHGCILCPHSGRQCQSHRGPSVVKLHVGTRNMLVSSAKFCCQHRPTCPPYISKIYPLHCTRVST